MAFVGLHASRLKPAQLPRTSVSASAPAASYPIADEGAWCWFADPRALHYQNDRGTINASYIGYIDIHGNIKATQVDFIRNTRTEVLIRSCFQPDDHNNPTFLVLPDERVMVFYTRHTDEPRIWYRVSRRKGDITTLGKEHFLATKHNTTYPSPFILSDDPKHIYLCWRGINWHPTIARLTLPNAKGQVRFDLAPRQIVQSTGARPYAKYQSNGRDKIYLTYTTGHPDNEWPNWLYFNVVDINHGQGLLLRDIKGHLLADIGQSAFKVNKTQAYQKAYPYTVVDAPTQSRDWVWQIATDEKERPVIAMTRISQDKNRHRYAIGRWDGRQWRVNDIADGGHAFHNNWQTLEKCYSGGMAIDPEDTRTVYASLPTDSIFELWKITLDRQGKVKNREQLTHHSPKNNVRPYVIPGHGSSSLSLCWMTGDYYNWMVKRQTPQGYPTAMVGNWPLPQAVKGQTLYANAAYHGQTEQIGRDTILGVSANNRLYLMLGKKRFTSPCLFLTSDDWARFSNGTNGDNWPTRISQADIRLARERDGLVLYRNGMVEMKVPEWRLVWSDEFNRDGLPDTTVWNYEQGFQRNSEAQWYQQGNAYQRDGYLIIEGRREHRPNPTYDPTSYHWARKRKTIDYTSTSLNTAGKREFRYGRLEVRAKIPTAGGAWPAIWTLGSGIDWPSCGEIDVMEFYRPNGEPHILANAAWGNDRPWNAVWNSTKTPLTHFTSRDSHWAEKFHTWRMDWDEHHIRLYLDDELLNDIDMAKVRNGSIGHGENPFTKPQYILLNLALGGDNGGKIDDSALPMQYVIDYVRIYERR